MDNNKFTCSGHLRIRVEKGEYPRWYTVLGNTNPETGEKTFKKVYVLFSKQCPAPLVDDDWDNPIIINVVSAFLTLKTYIKDKTKIAEPVIMILNWDSKNINMTGYAL